MASPHKAVIPKKHVGEQTKPTLRSSYDSWDDQMILQVFFLNLIESSLNPMLIYHPLIVKSPFFLIVKSPILMVKSMFFQ